MSGLNSAAATRLSSPSPIDDAPATHFEAGDSDTLNELASQLLELMRADGIAVAFRDDEGFVCHGSAGQAPGLGAIIQPGVGFCGACVQEGSTIVEQEIAGELGSLLAVPLMDEAEVNGCVAAFAFRRHAFSEMAVGQLTTVASHLAKYRRGATGTPRASAATNYEEFPTAAAVPEESFIAELREESLLSAAEATEDREAGHHELGTLSTIGVASVVVLLVLGLVSMIGHFWHSPAPATVEAVPVTQPPPVAVSVPAAEPIETKPVFAPKPKAAEAPPPMVVENSGVVRPKGVPELEPPPVAVETARVAPDIPIVVTSYPTLAPSALAHAAPAGSFREARLVREVSPKFPDLAKSANMSGDLELELTVSERGDVSGVWVIRGPAVFASSAMEAVKQWRYIPAQRNGKNVESKVRLQIRFKARK